MLPTPDLSHLSREDYQSVYEPAEDTFILLDALERDSAVLRRMNPSICLEIGSGSGCVSVFLQKLLVNSPLSLCTDINVKALDATRRTFRQNGLDEPELVHASLLGPLAARLRGKIDVLLFNPPYVPTEDAEQSFSQPDSGGNADIRSSWAGGRAGMLTTEQLLPLVPSLLAPGGRFYLVVVKENDPDGIVARMGECDATILLRRRAGREYLHVICISQRIARA